jgi:2C-methyl-D-erythritol 2,4-cyclodiphosphate synthase
MDKQNSFVDKQFIENQVYRGISTKIALNQNLVKINHTGASGDLTLYQSGSGANWVEYTQEISGSGSLQFSLTHNYYFIEYTHTDSESSLVSIITTPYIGTDAQLSADDTVTVNGLLFDEDGKLLVSSSGGGSGGDASEENQLEQIQIAENSNVILASLDTKIITCDTSTLATSAKQDSILSDLDGILNAVTGDLSVTVTNQIDISTLATSTIQTSSNIAQCERLDDIFESSDINGGYLQSIDITLTPLQQGIASYTLDAISTLAPDTVPAYSAPPAGINPSEGWYYKNVESGNTSQLYYYANQASQTQNHDYTISAIDSQWAVVRILNLDSSVATPYLVVYSQPQGSGDIIPGFARSRWVYRISSGQELRLGETVVIYRGGLPDSRIFPELRRVECSLSSTVGPGLTTELLAYASLNTDSLAPTAKAEYVVGGAGLSFAGDHIYKVVLTSESTPTVGDATAANQVSSNTEVCTRLDTGNDLLDTIAETLIDTLKCVTYGQVNDTPTYNPIRADTGGNLFVYDGTANTVLNLCKDELITMNTTLNNLVDGTDQLYVRLDGTDDSIQIWGFNPDSEMPEPIHTVNNAMKTQVTNQISDFATESTLANIEAKTDLMSFSDKGTYYTLRTAVDNFPSQTDVNIVNCSPDANGNLPVVISGYDIANDNVVQLRCSETAGLFVAPDTNALFTTRSQNVFVDEVETSGSISGPMQIGTIADSQGYLYVAAIIQFAAVTVSGNIYLELSHDGSIWARPAGASAFVNTSVSSTTVSIILSVPVALQYVRLWADTGFSATGCDAYISFK